jgi:hypothetical protein
MTPDMIALELEKDKVGCVDLYYNDLHALKLTFL